MYLLGGLFVLYLAAIAPAMLFPQVLALKRSRVVIATVVGALLWMGFNSFVSYATLAAGIIVS